ncbi:zinc finger protein 507-like [Gigantopelta aegis]|uniref:zinc finger protein 507-like n=1 Tax=Gigantopelta aegis TaxID=1735272 RepID=UPI001B888CA6|nr:zinc finger protein 507-like [Gigantopelta aegis]
MTEVCKPTAATSVSSLQKRSEHSCRISESSQSTPSITIYASTPPTADLETRSESDESGPLIIIEHIESPAKPANNTTPVKCLSVYGESDAGSPPQDGRPLFQCESCDYYSHNKHYLKQHVDLVHNADRPYKCPFCDYAGKRSHSLREHLVVHTNERPYECGYCNATFRKKGHLTNHIKLHTSQKSMIMCKLCNQTLPDVAAFEGHLKTNHNTDKLYACQRCEFVASDHVSIMNHVVVHAAENFYRCSKCSFITADVGSLASHADTHLPKQNTVPVELPVKDMMMKCTECGFSASDTNTMKSHLLKHLAATKTQVLPQTPVALPQTPHVLGYSIDQPLPQNASYKCTECNFTDKDATIFIKHLLTHKVKQQSAAKALQTEEIHQPQEPKPIVVTPIAKKNTCQNATPPFIFDQLSGRFRCIICGYTCEFQRTIKAHIWKHTGHKNINYPMFQNGPLSIYDDQTPIKIEKGVGQVPAHGTILSIKHPDELTDNLSKRSEVVESHGKNSSSSSSHSSLVQRLLSGHLVSDRLVVKPAVTSSSPSVRSDPDVVTEGGKTTAVKESPSKLTREDKVDGQTEAESLHPAKEATVIQSVVKKESEEIKAKPDSTSVTSSSSSVVSPVAVAGSDGHADLQSKQTTTYFTISSEIPQSASESQSSLKEMTVVSEAETSKAIHGITNQHEQWDESTNLGISVVVETVDTAPPSSVFTSMKSQQNSPRISDLQQASDAECAETGQCDDKYPKEIQPENESSQQSSSAKEDSVLKQTLLAADLSKDNESAITLLSLLKKGPNRNPAHVDSHLRLSDQTGGNLSPDGESRSDSDTDQASEGGDDSLSSARPKSGICSSLLAVIEQLRERANSEGESVISQGGRASISVIKKECLTEDDLPPENMENIEQLQEDGEIKYRCKFCHYSNPRALLIKLHMRLHKSKQPFECSLCSYIAKSSESLQDHMIKHCKVRTYQCKLCPSAFNYKSQLRAHMRAHSDKDPFCCESCDFETMDATTYRTHVRYHIDKSCFRCDSCKDIFPTLSDLNLHILELSCKNMLNCEECSFVADDNLGLINHIRETHRDFRCLECTFSCTTRLALTHHATSHHHSVASDDSGLLKCDLCDFTAVSSRSLKSHMKRHINDQRYVQQPLEQYKCNLCGYVCHHLPSLKSHMWRHASDRNYSYEFTNDVINAAIDYDCRIDSSKIDDPDLMEKILSSERQILEGRLSRSVCGGASAICWVTFRCCQCGFETINKADLNVHMKSHSDIIQRTLDVGGQPRRAFKRVGEDGGQTAAEPAKASKVEDSG